MNKPFLEDMSKEERQAFFYLEKMIIQSKVECLQAIPKTRVYDDSKIYSKLNDLEGKVKTVYHNDGLEKDAYELVIKMRNIINRNIQEVGEIFLLLSEISAIISEEELGEEKQRSSVYMHMKKFTELLSTHTVTNEGTLLKDILDKNGWEYTKKASVLSNKSCAEEK